VFDLDSWVTLIAKNFLYVFYVDFY